MWDYKGRYAEAMYDKFELSEDSTNKTRINLSTGQFADLPYGLADDMAKSGGAGFSTNDYDAGSRATCLFNHKAPWW